MTDEHNHWRPTATLEALRVRADTLASIRRFFDERCVLEVETPLLSAAAVTDLHLHSVACRLGEGDRGTRYLQTSPEYAMKRLLAAGSGPIYQICKVFRDGERGRRHNPEFTMLEWYRPGWDHHRLIDEVDELLQAVLGGGPGERIRYADAFRRCASVDPHAASDDELRTRVAALDVSGVEELDRDDLLNVLLSHVVEPRLGRGRPTFLVDYPASQAALARVRPGPPPVAERFEVFIDGVELANGFHELTDPGEQRRRFECDLEGRRRRGLPEVPVDERLLAALSSGLPDCAGVALGVDRLVMLRLGARDIADVVAFPIERA
ncbi:MAG TPA: EF-P lysine aminoacylase EpmA [Thermoanaerobaculales bacterium]|nr:EF-P lysine aminoacylase EpmA [Thermoanaerobaculales bacterium]HQN95728.1 EF-P lysine aminoacylase EpmA [Thermoanaerobaculales bacterium]HQP42140.1 EF-P lysine aminoacylase EpmA [Thermoanaerobaculales bacterium]